MTLDPYLAPPADARGARAREYEECIVALLREAADAANADPAALFRPGSVEISLRGERPDTEIVFRWCDGASEVVFLLWRSEYPTCGAEETLQAAAGVASAIWSDWTAGDLDTLNE